MLLLPTTFRHEVSFPICLLRQTVSPEQGGERAPFEPQPDGPVEDREARHVGEDPDVVLDVPTLNIEELDLEVEDLSAHVSVQAELADFVNINIGVDAYLDKVKLGIKGVEAQVLLLKVKLKRILGTIDRALSAIEQNPGFLDSRSWESNRGATEIEGSVTGPGKTEQFRPEATGEPGPEGATSRLAGTPLGSRPPTRPGARRRRWAWNSRGSRARVPAG